MTRFIFFSLVLATGSLATARAEQDLYNPLAVGMSWNLDIEFTPPSGVTVHGSAQREITGTEKMGRYTYFVIATTITGVPGMSNYTVFERKSAQGIYVIYSGDPGRREILQMALPLVVGQSWKTVVGNRMITSTVEAKESVVVGDKTYENCIKVSYTSSDGSVSGIFDEAPDVGNVVETTKRNGSIAKFTLKSFSGLK